MESNKMEETKVSFKVFNSADLKSDFVPWLSGEGGRQSYIKLSRGDETAFLYAGEAAVMQAEIQKTMMRLLNEGWTPQGEVHISFDGNQESAPGRLLPRHSLTVELGGALLPLVDSRQGEPLLESLSLIREELAGALGFVLPGINVRDNLSLKPNQYAVKVRESVMASGEIFLDRFMAVGSMDSLSKLTGWSFTEPSYRMPAKWIEIKDREEAEKLGCMVQGALNVILTHISTVITQQARRILGLQETADMLSALRETHPAVAEDFYSDTARLRAVQKILHGLLREQVPVKDLVTILETAGEHLDDLSNIPLMIEYVREALSHQICWSLVDDEGYINAFTIHSDLEREIRAAVVDALGGAYLSLSRQEDERLSAVFRETFSEVAATPVIVTEPAVRRYLSSYLMERGVPAAVVSVSEIEPEFKIVFVGEVKGNMRQDAQTKKTNEGTKKIFGGRSDDGGQPEGEEKSKEKNRKAKLAFWKKKLEEGE